MAPACSPRQEICPIVPITERKGNQRLHEILPDLLNYCTKKIAAVHWKTFWPNSAKCYRQFSLTFHAILHKLRSSNCVEH